MSAAITYNQEVRRLILMVLHEARLQRKTESGGWLQLRILRKLLSLQGYDLNVNDVADFCVQLSDADARLIDYQKAGEEPPYKYLARITYKGVRVVTGEEKFPGIGS